MIKNLCYIFHVHNTFDNWHIDMAIESIGKQTIDRCKFKTFLIYNVSQNIKKDFIISCFKKHKLDQKFANVEYYDTAQTKTKSVSEDFETHRKNISNHDAYLLHKSDFYLPNQFFKNVVESPLIVNKDPHYINFCKFDLRESASSDLIRHMSTFKNYSELSKQSFACDTGYYQKYPKDLSFDHIAIGYRGKIRKINNTNRTEHLFDGVMHMYNEKARCKMTFDSYWDFENIRKNRNLGVKMECSTEKFFTLHMFHDIGRTDKMKIHKGHRF